MNITIPFSKIICCNCRFIFAVPSDVKSSWQDNHTNFYCPSCKCSQSYLAETNEERLKKEVSKYKRSYEEKLECCVNLQSEV